MDQTAVMSQREPSGTSETFRRFALATSVAVGTPWAFSIVFGVLVVWAILGPIYHFSDTWQLVINTGTTIVTFLMVFLIQNTQNRDARAIHLKLDELLRGVKGSRTSLMELEKLSDKELEELHRELHRLRETDREEQRPDVPQSAATGTR
jgi:low affinity Fe/Cu permease